MKCRWGRFLGYFFVLYFCADRDVISVLAFVSRSRDSRTNATIGNIWSCLLRWPGGSLACAMCDSGVAAVSRLPCPGDSERPSVTMRCGRHPDGSLGQDGAWTERSAHPAPMLKILFIIVWGQFLISLFIFTLSFQWVYANADGRLSGVN